MTDSESPEEVQGPKPVHDDTFNELPAGYRHSVQLLTVAAVQRSQAELKVQAAVIRARRQGVTWDWIGACLNTSGSAAHSRYRWIVHDGTLHGRKETSADPE